MHNVSAAILFSVASLEANINETFIDSDIHFAGHNQAMIKAMWTAIEDRETVLKKYEIALIANTGAEFDKGASDYQDVASLIKLRNALVHAKPEWYDQQKEYRKLEDRLKGKFIESPFLPASAQFFPQRCMSHGCAKWAVLSSLAFIDGFSTQAGLMNRYVKHLAQLKPD
jgi:hypothetical protein